MIVSTTQSVGFVHFHKTAGHSVRKLFDQLYGGWHLLIRPEYGQGHIPYRLVKQYFPGEARRIGTIFTFVRNPYAHAVSLYFYWKIQGIKIAQQPLDTFLEHVQNDWAWKDYVYVENRLPVEVHVLRLEEASGELTRLLGQSVTLPHTHQTPGKESVRLSRRATNLIKSQYSLWFDWFYSTDVPEVFS